jgi:hypothetical protein
LSAFSLKKWNAEYSRPNLACNNYFAPFLDETAKYAEPVKGGTHRSPRRLVSAKQCKDGSQAQPGRGVCFSAQHPLNPLREPRFVLSAAIPFSAPDGEKVDEVRMRCRIKPRNMGMWLDKFLRLLCLFAARKIRAEKARQAAKKGA